MKTILGNPVVIPEGQAYAFSVGLVGEGNAHTTNELKKYFLATVSQSRGQRPNSISGATKFAPFFIL